MEYPRLNRITKARPVCRDLITDAFDALAKSEKEAFGAPDHPVLVVQHPIGTVKVEEVNKRADAAFDQLVELLVEPRKD